MATTTGSMGKVTLHISGVRDTKVNPTYYALDSLVTRTPETGMPGGTSGPVRPTTGQLYPRGV